MHKTNWLAMAVAGVALVGGGCATSHMPVAMVPPAAQKAIEQYAEGGTISEMEMDKEHGMVFYEADVTKADGSKLKIVVNQFMGNVLKDGSLFAEMSKDAAPLLPPFAATP